MMDDHELDEALAGLGNPAGAEPRTTPAALLLQARRLVPVAVVAPWSWMRSGGLLAAGVLMGVGGTQVVEGWGHVAVDVAAALNDEDAVATGGGSVTSGDAAVATGSSGGVAGEDSVATEDRTTASAEDGRGAAEPRRPRARRVRSSGGTSAPASLAGSGDAPGGHAPDGVVGPTGLPDDDDLRLTRPAPRPQDPDVASLGAIPIVTVERPDPTPLPLNLRLLAGVGGAPALPDGAGVLMAAGVSWTPATVGFARPEVLFDLGVGAFSEEAGLRGEQPTIPTWSMQARAGAGFVMGDGYLRGAVDWTVAASIPLDEEVAEERRHEHAGLPLATGPQVALVLGRPGDINGRIGATADFTRDFAPHSEGALRILPSVFLALEVPLGDGEKEN